MPVPKDPAATAFMYVKRLHRALHSIPLPLRRWCMTTIMQMENLQIDEIPAEDERPRKRGRPTKVEVEAREAAKKEAEEKEAARRNAEKVLGG